MARRLDPPPTVRELLALCRHLNIGAGAGSEHDQAGIEYLDLTRWNGPAASVGADDPRARAIFLALLRDALDVLDLDEIGAATLAELDAEKAPE